MAFDGIVLKSVITELQSYIIGGKISKVFQPSKNDIVLGIYSNGKNYALNICINSAKCRFHITTNSKPNPLVAPNFCMFLRKHLIGCRIKSINNFDLERLVTLELEGYDELNDLTTKKLIIELMGKHSNIILLNNNNFIINSLRHIDTSNSYRNILPAHEYILPTNNKISFLDLKDFQSFYNNIKNNNFIYIDKAITNTFIGISMPFVQNIINKLCINNLDFSIINLEKIFNYITDILSNIGTNKISFCNYQNDYVIDLHEKKSDLEINFSIDDFYFNKETLEIFNNYKNRVLKLVLEILKKYKTRLININNKIIDVEQKDIYKLYGELLTNNLYKFKNEHLKEITLLNYYNNELLTIPLDNTISIFNNSKKYFKKYNKLKNSLEIINIQKKETEQELDYIESIIYNLENCQTISDIDYIYSEISENILSTKSFNKKKTTNNKLKDGKNINSNFIEYYINDFKILVGKNNKQNDYLTTKIANNNDIWFHTKDIPGSHVVLKTDGKNINNDILIQCAQISAYHSKAQFSSNVAVDYCNIKYVKKPSKSKPGMVIYTNNKTLYVNPKIII